MGHLSFSYSPVVLHIFWVLNPYQVCNIQIFSPILEAVLPLLLKYIFADYRLLSTQVLSPIASLPVLQDSEALSSPASVTGNNPQVIVGRYSLQPPCTRGCVTAPGCPLLSVDAGCSALPKGSAPHPGLGSAQPHLSFPFPCYNLETLSR